MAILNGKYGFLTQSAGNVVMSSWKGKNVLRDKAVSYNDANTPTQQANRRKFSLLILIGKGFLSAVRVGFKKLADQKKITEPNQFTAANYANVIDSGSISVLDPTLITIAAGSTLGVENAACSTGGGAGLITVTADDNTDGATGLGSDEIQIMVMVGDKVAYKFTQGGLLRSGAVAGASISLGAQYTGQVAHVYTFAQAPASGICSPSSYSTGTIG
ncbi:MAG: hypothetical protein ACI9YB_003064 [Halioglobus sp.]|jgi:hypothetical protein